MGNKLEDFLDAIKLGELIHRKDPMERRRHCIMCVLMIVGAVAAIAAIAYAVYRYINPNYLEDFDDDVDEDYDEADSTETEEADSDKASTSEE